MLILNIDTSIDLAYIAIAKNGEILADDVNTNQKNNASHIHITIKLLCEKAQIKLSDLEAIAVAIGPGSYTGLRVGLATAKGLCYALKIPLITISTLELMASHAIAQEKNEADLYCPMIDARRMEVFAAMYNRNLNLYLNAQAVILTAETFGEILNKNTVCFFGNGLQKWKTLTKNKHALFFDNQNYNQIICTISFKKMEKNEFSSLYLIEPLYVKEFYTP